MIVRAMICFAALFALSGQAFADCAVSDAEREIIRETSRWRTDAGHPEQFSHFRGRCAVVSVSIAADGSVSRAEVLRFEGGGVWIWHAIVMGQRYRPRDRAWTGLVSFITLDAAPDLTS